MIRVIIPTIKTYDQVKQQIADIRHSVPPSVEVLATCKKASAAENRNTALSWCEEGDTIVMLDDDISGYHEGWLEAIIEPLEHGACLSSARLTTKSGDYGPQIGALGRNEPDVYEAIGGAVPSAAIAWKVDDLIFDENYQGAGWEDTDFCRQMKLKYPNKQIVITTRCRLIHGLEFKHFGADTPNSIYFKDKWDNKLSLDCLVFTRNRPAQLDTLLTSVREFMPTLHNTIHVLYSYSSNDTLEGYTRVFRRHRNALPYPQTTFISDVRSIVGQFSKKYSLMLVDDGVFIRTPDIRSMLQQYSDDVCTASLRLSPTASYCTPASSSMDIPRLEGAGDVLKWNYTTSNRHMDWGYPHGIDGNIFRTEYLKSLVNSVECNNPNELEARIISKIPEDKPNMICGRQTSWLLISANRVASGNTPNAGQSTEEMNSAYLQGYELDNSWRGKENLEAVNIVAPYVITKPTIGVHFHDNGCMNGCWKVYHNTIKGLEIAGLPYSKNIEKYNGAINTFGNMPKNTLVGPETMVLPRENYGLWQQFHNHAVPCQWVKDSYLKDEATHGNNIVIWPVGVDTMKWAWRWEMDDSFNCLIFEKNVNLTPDVTRKRVADIVSILDAEKIPHRTLRYGSYTEDELMAATKWADFAVWVSGTESQNIALLEVLSTGIPVYVYDQTEQSYSGVLMEGLTSAPYFDDRCGMKRYDVNDLRSFIDKVEQYKPRDFIMDYFTLDKCAKNYYKMVTECL